MYFLQPRFQTQTYFGTQKNYTHSRFPFLILKTGAVLNCVNGELIQLVAQVGVTKKKF